MKHYSQRDTRWKDDIIDNSENQTIGDYGCLLTCVAMVCTEFGHDINPGELNKLYKAVNGFDGANLIIRLVSSFYPDIYQAELIPCGKDIDAPLATINSFLDDGIPVIVQVDESPKPNLQEHWVVITDKQDSDYSILDPWDTEPYHILLTDYSFNSNDLAHIITSVLVLNHIQVSQAQPVDIDDEYNAGVVAPYGAALRRAPRVSSDTLLVYLPAGTRLNVSHTLNEIETKEGIILLPVLCYMAEADLDGTQILKVDDDA